MKVALLSGSARLDDAVGKYTYYLARELARVSNSKVDVVLAGPMSPQFSAEAVRIIRFESLLRRGGRWLIDRLPKPIAQALRVRFHDKGFRSVRSLAQEISSADLVWDVFASASMVHRIPIELRHERSPIIVLDYHGITPPELANSHSSQELHESIEELRMSAPSADRFVVHSKFMANELAARAGVTEKFDVCGLFCDPELINAWQMPQRLLNDSFFILFVGRVTKHKGLDTLIRALKIVRERGFDAKVSIVGSEASGDDVIQQTKHLASSLGVAEHVIWLGKLNSITLRLQYYTADVLVLPSRHEGFGLPAIEAMWFDLPVIVSNSGALPEIVKDAALVFEVNDFHDLADKLITLHCHAEVRSRTLRAARSVRQSFTVEKFAKNVSRLYESYVPSSKLLAQKDSLGDEVTA